MQITADNLQQLIAKMVNDPKIPKGQITVTIEGESSITKKQTSALHVWCREQADAWNSCGFEQVTWIEISSGGLEHPWTEETVKNNVFKPILKAITGKDSTKDMNTVEPSVILGPLVVKLNRLTPQVPVLNWPSNR